MKRLFIVWLLLGSLLNSYILFTQDVKASESLSGNPPQKKFLNPNRIRYDGSCMTIDGKDVFIYSAAFHYFRCPEELWRDRFRDIKAAGFNTVETYVPWNWHERIMPASPEDNTHFDFADLKRWLKMAQEEFGLPLSALDHLFVLNIRAVAILVGWQDFVRQVTRSFG